MAQQHLDPFASFVARRGVLQQLRAGVPVVLRDGLGTYSAELRAVPAEAVLTLGAEGPDGLCGPVVRIEFADVSVLAVDSIRGERCLRLDTMLGDQFYLSPAGPCAVTSDDMAETLSKLIEKAGGVATQDTPPSTFTWGGRDDGPQDCWPSASRLDHNREGESQSIVAELRKLHLLIEEKNRVVAQLADTVATLQSSFQAHIVQATQTTTAAAVAERPGTAAHPTSSSSRDFSPNNTNIRVIETDDLGELIQGANELGIVHRNARQRPLTAGGILRHPSTLVVSFDDELRGNGTDSLRNESSSSLDEVEEDRFTEPRHADPTTVFGSLSTQQVPKDGHERRERGQYHGSRRTNEHRAAPSHQQRAVPASNRPIDGSRPPRRGPGIGDLGDEVLARVSRIAAAGPVHDDDVDDEHIAAYRDINGSTSSSLSDES